MDHELEAAQRAHDANVQYLVRRSMTKGYQLFSILTPPVYTAFVLLRKPRGHFTVNRLLRATWLGGAAGVGIGGGLSYARASTSSSETLQARRITASFVSDSLRADDHATIGALLFSVLTPAVFWKRATTIHLIFGGAGLGTSVGLLTHWFRHLTGDPAPVTPIPDVLKAELNKN